MSKASNKPTPPPLDEGDQNANTGSSSGSVPHAESGKATAEDAQRASAEDARNAARAAAAQQPQQTDEATAAAAAANAVDETAGRPPQAVKGDKVARARAVVSESSGQLVARPDPAAPPSAETHVVLSNWFGHVEDKPCHVKYGTPIEDLPRAVQRAIANTKGIKIGPIPPKLPDNPFTP